jgi:hypothetical protein
MLGVVADSVSLTETCREDQNIKLLIFCPEI